MKKIFFFLFSLMFMCSCSTVQDGPPSYHVDVSKIPNAKPKIEPLSKIGNKPSYQVFGKKYYVMRSSKNYQEQGLASWYGTKFHQRMTTSGEPYDMLGMTAAHKTLPLPTYVEVTNLANGKKVIVKVNDRGPFSGNRLIDLSYVAARKLGMIGPGVAHVEVRALDPGVDHILRAPVFVAKSSAVFLQVGAFQNKSNAENLKNQLAKLINSPVQITEFFNIKHYYRVQIGPLLDGNTAAKIHQQLKLIGLQAKQIIA